jgi:hypothetical protein
MPIYAVRLPITGVLEINIEAEDEESAIEKALQSDDLNVDYITEWDAVREIVRGNLFRGKINKAEADEIEE